MKKIYSIILTAFIVLALAVCALAATYSQDNPCTKDNFVATEGYTVYGIFGNENVKFYDLAGEEPLEIENVPPVNNDSAISELTAAVWGFRDLWYSYDGYCMALNSNAAMDITFEGTAINLGLILYRGSGASMNMSAKVTVDGQEYTITPMDMTSLDQELSARLCCPRYFKLSGLENGTHTLRLESTGTERFLCEYYEVSDKVAEVTTEEETTAVADTTKVDGTTASTATADVTTAEDVTTDKTATENKGGLPTWALILIIAGAVAVIAVIAVIIAKKKK